MSLSLTALFIISCIGVADTLYLIYHKVQGTDVACPFFPPEWCKKVQYSKQSKTFGVPNSVLGFFMYVIVASMVWTVNAELTPLWPLQITITFGFLFSSYFLYVQAFVLKAFCTWCVLSAINFILMTLLVFFFV